VAGESGTGLLNQHKGRDMVQIEVFPTTQGVTVYVNELDEISITQEGYGGGDNVSVSIPIQYVDALCRALKTTVKEFKEL
jgi:hypothetical protein